MDGAVVGAVGTMAGLIAGATVPAVTSRISWSVFSHSATVNQVVIGAAFLPTTQMSGIHPLFPSVLPWLCLRIVH